MKQPIPEDFKTHEELDALLAEGFASPEMPEDEFWDSVNQQTDILLREH